MHLWHPLQRLYPLTSRLRSRLGAGNGYKTHATRSWTLHPEEHVTIPAALFNPDDLARVTGVAPDDTLTSQFQRAAGGPGLHSATVAYELHDAILSRGHLFTRKVCYRVSCRQPPVLAARPEKEFAHAVLASSPYGIKFFGHWMTDDLPLHLAAREIGPPVSVLTTPTPSQQYQLERLGLDSDTVEDACFEKIVVIDDVGQNAYKRRRVDALRAIMSGHAPAQPLHGVMLLRGASGARRALTNEAEVADLARARGFAVFDPSMTDPAEIVQACLGAHVVLGVEGSHLTNGMLWMSLEGTVVVLQPPQRFVMVLKDWCDCMNVRYAFIVGHARGPDAFEVDLNALQRRLDLAMT